MPRLARRQRITELVAQRSIRSQDELRRVLAHEGIEATQATLSRDLNALGVAKGPSGYQVAETNGHGLGGEDVLRRALRRSLISAETGGNVVVLRTPPGHANALAIEFDRERPADVLGTIAGDDTIFVAARSPASARQLRDRVRRLSHE